ncbi:hypothetical protein CFPU101_34500 [Chroococcus sp. FPU101]|nr:hypothetical protein CFPU101_34500 [Chroococcus sp. FPU101]
MTSLYRSIFLVSLDERTEDIYVLAGEKTEILIDKHGNGNLYDIYQLSPNEPY